MAQEQMAMTVKLLCENPFRKVTAWCNGESQTLLKDNPLHFPTKYQTFHVSSDYERTSVKLQVMYEPLSFVNPTPMVTCYKQTIPTPSTMEGYHVESILMFEVSVTHPTHVRPHFHFQFLHACQHCKQMIPRSQMSPLGCCQREGCNQFAVIYQKQRYPCASHCLGTNLIRLPNSRSEQSCHACGSIQIHVPIYSVSFLTCD